MYIERTFFDIYRLTLISIGLIMYLNCKSFTKERDEIMTTEEKLKAYILERYKSVREFALSNDIPQPTVSHILIRGLDNAGLSRVMQICKALGISCDALAEGEIVLRSEYEKLSPEERRLLIAYRKADARGKQAISDTAARERGFSRSEGSEEPDDRPSPRPELDAVLKAAGSRARQQPSRRAHNFEMRE